MPNRPTVDDDDDQPPAILNSRRAMQDMDDGASVPGLKMNKSPSSEEESEAPPPPIPGNIHSFSNKTDGEDPAANEATTMEMNGFEVSLSESSNGHHHIHEELGSSTPKTTSTEASATPVTSDTASLGSDSAPLPPASTPFIPPSELVQEQQEKPEPPKQSRYFPPPPASTFLGDQPTPAATTAATNNSGSYLIDMIKQRSSDFYNTIASVTTDQQQQEEAHQAPNQASSSVDEADEENPGFNLIDHLRRRNQGDVDTEDQPTQPTHSDNAISGGASVTTKGSSVGGGGGASISMMHTSIAMMHMRRVDDGTNGSVVSENSMSRGGSVAYSATSDNSRRLRSSGRSRYHQRRIIEEPPSPTASRNAKSGDGEESKEEIHTQDGSSFKSGRDSSRYSSSQRGSFPLSNFQTFSPTHAGGGPGGDDESLTDEDDIVDDLDGDAGSIVSEATAERSNRSGSLQSVISERSGFSGGGSLRSGRSGYSGRSKGSGRVRMGRYRYYRRHGSKSRTRSNDPIGEDDDDQTDASSVVSGRDDDEESVLSTASSVTSARQKFNDQFQRMVERMAQKEIAASEAIQERRKQEDQNGILGSKSKNNVYISYAVILLFILAPVLGRLVWKNSL